MYTFSTTPSSSHLSCGHDISFSGSGYNSFTLKIGYALQQIQGTASWMEIRARAAEKKIKFYLFLLLLTTILSTTLSLSLYTHTNNKTQTNKNKQTIKKLHANKSGKPSRTKARQT
jgi:hypothetical protein